MSTITTTDGTQIDYMDWGSGQPVVFNHGWPLSADAWEDQMLFMAAHGYRCITHDRRGHGRSSQPWQGNDMITYADDLATLVATLDLTDAIHVGHSTGDGEVVRFPQSTVSGFGGGDSPQLPAFHHVWSLTAELTGRSSKGARSAPTPRRTSPPGSRRSSSMSRP
jgi:pimeloyl-ACP methyl ester carboxylesterase